MQNGADRFVKTKPQGSDQSQSTTKPAKTTAKTKEATGQASQPTKTTQSSSKPKVMVPSQTSKLRPPSQLVSKNVEGKSVPDRSSKGQASNPWNYKLGTGHTTLEDLAIDDGATDSIFVEIEGEDDSKVLADLLQAHTRCSALFSKRLVNQKLADTLQLLDMDCKSDFIRGVLDEVVQFMLMRPEFFVEQENDGYCVFKGLIRSEVYSFLDFVLGRREKELHEAVVYQPKELQGLMAKLENLRSSRDQIYEYLQSMVSAIVPESVSVKTKA